MRGEHLKSQKIEMYILCLKMNLALPKSLAEQWPWTDTPTVLELLLLGTGTIMLVFRCNDMQNGSLYSKLRHVMNITTK